MKDTHSVQRTHHKASQSARHGVRLAHVNGLKEHRVSGTV